MIILNEPITVNGREYWLCLTAYSADGKSGIKMSTEDKLELMEEIINKCLTYQDKVE